MKKQFSWIIPLGFVAMALGYYSFLFNTDPDLADHNPTATTYTFSYPPPAGIIGTDQDWRVFLSLGDGTFWMGSQQGYLNETFTYSTTASYDPILEYTPTYDDNTKPPKRKKLPTPKGMVSSTNPPIRVQMPATKADKLHSTRDPKPGDIITYIITYQHNQENCSDSMSGSLVFTFDDDVLNYEESKQYKSESVSSPNISNSIGTMTINFGNLMHGEQRNVFLFFTTETFQYGSRQMDEKPKVVFSATCGDKVVADTFAMTSQQITNSHDPNKKIAADNLLCQPENFVDFTVTFQNDGPGMTDSVKVTDELDAYLVLQHPTLMAWSTPKKPDIYFETSNPTDRTIVFNFRDLRLNGLAEPGYGTLFGEDATMATFTFRCETKPTVADSFCNAVMNQAKIYFDCNPPIETPLAMAPISCTTSCDPCSTVSDSTYTNTFTIGNAVLPAGVPVPSGYQFYHWYPEEGLSNAFVANPILTSLKHREYTLVASSGSTAPTCQKQIVRVKANNACTLQIQITTPISPGPCSGSSSGNIVATAVGYVGGPSDLVWQDCTTGVSSTQAYNPGYTTYRFGVTDQSTGCTAEMDYTVPEPSLLHVDDISNNCSADLIISGGTPPYIVTWTYQDANGSPQTATGLSLDLHGKSSVLATIIDSNACTTVFTPKSASCCGIPPWGWWALAIAGLVIAAYLVISYFKKQ